MEALSLMIRSQNARLLVTESDRLVGIVTLKSLMNYLNAKLQLERADLVDLRPRRAAARDGGLSQRA